MTGAAHTTLANWPESPTVHLRDVRVPIAILDSETVHDVDRDGLVAIDMVIEHGKVSDILPLRSTTAVPSFDARGGQAWTTFADLHTHLDKGHIWPRVWNVDGTIESARANTRKDTIDHWKAEDVEARFEFGLRTAYAQGTSAMRTHLDCLVPGQAEISFGVFRRLRERWKGRITLQASALVSTDLYDDPQNAALADLIASVDGKLGGIVFRLDEAEDSAIIDGKLDRLFALAAARKLDVDLHVDENGSPASMALAQVAQAVLRANFKGHVVCGHCCSLSVLDDANAARTIALVKEAGLTVVSLPLVNQYLQGRRPGETPRWRGLTLLRELKQAGIPVVLASDNCRDAHHEFGDHDLLEVFGCGVRLGHLDVEIGRWPDAVTSVPGEILKGPRRLKKGSSADLVLFEGRTHSELLARRQSNRIVVRAGRAIDTALPNYRELDHLVVPSGPLVAIS